MIKNYYVAADKITHRISEDVLPGNHIRLNGLRFELISKRPLGKSVYKRLRSMDEKTQLIIYN
jgi:hypothetical protein